MNRRRMFMALLVLLATAGAAYLAATTATHAQTPSAAAPTAAPAIDPSADRLLRSVGTYLGEAKTLCFKSEEWVDVLLPGGQKIQTTRAVSVQLARPGKLHVDITSPRRSYALWLRDKSLTLLDRRANFYGIVEAADTIDKTIDMVEEKLGIEIPVADVLVSDPYQNAMQGAQTGVDLGKVTVLGVSCRHLAFTGKNLDWQLWVQDGPKPLPRKLVLNFKTKIGSPQLTAIFSDWDLQGPISDATFTFHAPDGALKIDVAKAVSDPEAAASQPAAK